MNAIDVDFDVRSDAGTRDPDTHSKTLREYHRLLWSKPLPNGQLFSLDTQSARRYLHHRSTLGEFFLASDTVVSTWRSWRKMANVIAEIPAPELDAFQRRNHTIGGMLVFPGDRRAGVLTLNGARGFSPQIADRFDLTLECIRRFYLQQPSPLASTINGYADFFNLFGTFKDYCEFFLLQDLTFPDFLSVRMFTGFDNFASSPLPTTAAAYRSYQRAAMQFIRKRNRRIATWANLNLALSSRSSRKIS